jgi:hypothetical protein
LSHVAIQQFNAKISTKDDKESKKKDSHDQRDSMIERRACIATNSFGNVAILV